MATFPCLLSVLQITTCLFVSGSVVRAALPPEAQEAFDKGVAASDKGQYLDAIASFERARQKAQTKTIFDAPEIYRKLGETEAKVPGRELRAICWLAAYLSVVPEAGDADSIRKQIIDLRRTGRDRLWQLMQMTGDAGQKVAAREDARGLKQTSLDSVVYLWAECGGYAEARKVASTIVDASTRSQAYNRVTYAQVKAGDFAGAWTTIPDQEKAAAAIDNPDWNYYWRCEARVDLIMVETRMAEEQLKAGDLDGARVAIAKARQTAKLLGNDGMNNEWVSQASCAIATAQAAAGDIKGAQATVLLIKGEYAKADHKIDARIAIAEAQMKAGDLAGARSTLITTQQDDELRFYTHGRKEIELASAVAELEHIDPKLNAVYHAIGLAQVHCGDWEGAQRTVKCMDSGEGALLEGEIAHMAGGAPASAFKVTINSWLQEIEGSQMWRVTRGLDEPLFTDFSHYAEELRSKGGDADQTLSGFDRAVREMQGAYSKINRMLKEQFGL